MPNENPVGYQVLDLRVSEIEKDVKEVTKDLRDHIRKNDDEHKEMRANIAESTLSVREIKLMITQMSANGEEMKKNFKETSDEIKRNFKETSDEIKKNFKETNDEIKSDVKALGEASNKEKGWRAIIVDLIKIIILILGFIATGKFVL